MDSIDHVAMSQGADKTTLTLALAAAAGTGIQVGAAMVATRFVVGQAGPVSLALLRYIVGFLCLLPPVIATARHVRFAARDLAPIAALGIAQFGILVALLNWGLRSVPAGRGALLFATFPLMTMLIAAALGQERLTWRRTLGVLLTIAGVGLAVAGKLGGEAGAAGDLAVLGAALCGALCSVFYRPYLRRYPALPVSALAMLASVVALALFAGPTEGFFAAWPRFTLGGWAAVLFIGVSSGIGYLLWLWALGRAPATQVTVFLSLSPVTAALLGALLLGEPLTAAMVAGLACLAAGLWAASAR
jgi:drug/metabolite transporter (DMT)-like permease